MTGLTGRVHSMAQEEGGVATLARWRVRRRWRSVSAGEGGRGRPAGPGGPKAEWASWLLGRLGRKLKKSFQNKNWIFEFANALKICTRRFRRNFDTRIFPKFF
jgi:hypothetical protein